MREKVFALIAMVTTLLAGSTIVNPTVAQLPTTAVSIRPVVSTGLVGGIVNVDINISDVTALYYYEFRLYYDANTLTALEMLPARTSTNGPGFFFSDATG